ncbi:MAG: peptide-methionine (S)-S-oxide reductase MsrA [Gemmatimonadaceae bacterium]
MRSPVLFGTVVCGLALAATALAGSVSHASSSPVHLPDPTVDEPLATHSGTSTAVLAGGCFWGLQLVFQHVKGVTGVTAGYAGGTSGTATYDQVSTGETGHAESVRITYDPSRVTYGRLLKVFFSVATDPTELNRQGPDVGSQYRSAIFYGNQEQQRVAAAYIAQLGSTKSFSAPIVTQVVPLKGFFAAEDYHQDFAIKHPDYPYIVINDAPKLKNLAAEWPALYQTAAAR